MRVVLQRVAWAEVIVAGATIARIDRGLLLLVGLAPGDGEPALVWMAQKIACGLGRLRRFHRASNV